jgi:transcriptional regulator with XRE-family HTH domain
MKKSQILENFARALGKVITRRRTELGLTQEELAHQCGLHRTYISDIERGKRNFTMGCFYRLAYTLKLKPVELIELAKPEPLTWNRTND